MRETAGQHCLKFNLQCSLFNKAINVTVSVTVKLSFIQSLLKGENQLSVYITEVSAVYYKGIIVMNFGVLFGTKGTVQSTESYMFAAVYSCRLFNNYSSSPNGL